MPVERCTKGGRPGHRWGESGFCYLGPGSRAKAARQGRAVEAAKRRREDAAVDVARRVLPVPEGIEEDYVKELRRHVRRLHKVLTTTLNRELARLPGIDERARGDAAAAHPPAGAERRRDTAEEDNARLQRVIRATERAWNQAAVGRVNTEAVVTTARNIERTATQRTVQTVERIAGIPIDSGAVAGASEGIVSVWTAQNVDLIKTIDRRHFGDVARVVEDSLRKGRRTRDLKARIAERFGVSDRRAQLIARDQLASLNMRITEARQTELGISRYRWTTSGDDRVRDEHAEIDGEIFTWASGHPTEGHPGQPISCRCVAIPVIPDDFSVEG